MPCAELYWGARERAQGSSGWLGAAREPWHGGAGPPTIGSRARQAAGPPSNSPQARNATRAGGDFGEEAEPPPPSWLPGIAGRAQLSAPPPPSGPPAELGAESEPGVGRPHTLDQPRRIRLSH